MSRRLVVVRSREEFREAKVVVDLVGAWRQLMPKAVVITPKVKGEEVKDVVVIGGRELTTVIAVSTIEEGIPIAWGKHTGKPVGARVKDTVVLAGIVPTLYLYEENSLIEELTSVGLLEDPVNEAVAKLKEIILEERRRKGFSTTARVIERLAENPESLEDVPPYVQDVLYGLDPKLIKAVAERIRADLY